MCCSQEPYLRIPKEIFIVARVAVKINFCICFREYTYLSATEFYEFWCEYVVDCTWTDHGHSNDQSPVFVAVQATCPYSEIGSHTTLYGTVRCLRCTFYRWCFEVQICALLQIVAFITVVDIYEFFINRCRKIANKRLLASSCLVCLPGRMEQLGFDWTDFYEIWFLSILHEDLCTFVVVTRSILLRTRNVSDNSCRENENTRFILVIVQLDAQISFNIFTYSSLHVSSMTCSKHVENYK